MRKYAKQREMIKNERQQFKSEQIKLCKTLKRCRTNFATQRTTKRGETVEQSEKHDSIMYENCCQSVKMSIYIVMHHEHKRKAKGKERE